MNFLKVKVPSTNKVPPMVPQQAHSRHSISSNSNSLKIGVVPGSGGNSVANLMRVVSNNYWFSLSVTSNSIFLEI